MYRHIVVALDGSAEAERVLPHVEALAHRFGSQISLIRAVTPLEAGLMGEAMVRRANRGGASSETARQESQYNVFAYLTRIQARLQEEGLSAQIECPEGRHGKAIVERARDLGADLIAMTTHGHGGLKRAVLGSVADEVVRTAPCAVLLVRCD
jgi:nucleotide-binding universal stress UspA family protein